MWKWIDAEHTSASLEQEDGTVLVCGINMPPLLVWLEEGNVPEEWNPEGAE